MAQEDLSYRVFERVQIEGPCSRNQSEGFRAFEADRSLKEKMRQRQFKKEIMKRMKGRDRNSPCPCGSGKKYKKCHGQQAVRNHQLNVRAQGSNGWSANGKVGSGSERPGLPSGHKQ
jgi:hypothetical protein